MKGLTTRQKEILQFVKDQFRENQFWPSIREIQEQFGFKSTNAVMGHLRALERKGFLSRAPGQARTFKVAYDDGENPRLDNNDVVTLPIYGAIAAGYPEGVESGGEIGRLQIDSSYTSVRRNANAFALKVRGDSMIDVGIFDGDLVVVEPGTNPRNGAIVAALIDGETTLKRYVKTRGHAPYLKAENPDFPALFPVSELIIQGVAKAVVRSL
ncbi:MAG: transcriptional repressor LexA [Verrucomicrobiota bacterium]